MEFPHFVLARLYENIEPLDRGDRYEDPLQAVLDQSQAGLVTGGGSQLNALGGIEYAEVEIELANLDAALGLAIKALEDAGAPQGSEVIHDGKVIREFGALQCLAVYLDGTSLPAEVYANLDFETVMKDLGSVAGPGSYRGFWQGPQETGLYFYGSSAEDIFKRVEPLLGKLPIGQNARVVLRHGKQSLNPREVRMPRH